MKISFGYHWFFAFITSSFLSTFAYGDGDMVFFTDRGLKDAGPRELHQILTGHSLPRSDKPHSFLLLDSHWGDSRLAKENIIGPHSMPGATRDSYETMSPSNREGFIFRPFLASILNGDRHRRTPRVIHIDHHYDIPSLRSTSTSVLSLDFILWLHASHKNGHLSDDNFEAAMDILENAIPIVDHTDADIILANAVFKNVRSESRLSKIASLIQAVALYNDYVRLPEDSELQQKVLVAFAVMQELEAQLKIPSISFSEAFETAVRTMEIVMDLEVVSETGTSRFDSYVYDLLMKPETLPDTPQWNAFGEISKYFISGFEKTLPQTKAATEALATRVNELTEIVPGQNLSYFDEASGILFVSVNNRPGSLASVFSEVQTDKKLSRAKIVVGLVLDENGNLRIKLRSRNLDLNPIWKSLKENSLDAGGRARAGTAAYGFSGLSSSDWGRVVPSDLQRILKILTPFATHSCRGGLQSLGDSGRH